MTAGYLPTLLFITITIISVTLFELYKEGYKIFQDFLEQCCKKMNGNENEKLHLFSSLKENKEIKFQELLRSL